MQFQFDRWEYKVKPSAYITVIKGKNGNQDMCSFDVRPIDNTQFSPPTVVLGLGFLRSYDFIIDADDKRIGLYTTEEGMIEDHESHGLSLFWDIAIGIFSLLLIASIVFLCVYCYKKR